MSVGSDTLSGAAAGASMGSMAGPIGTAIGGGVGAIAGLIGGASKKKKRDQAAALAAQRPQYEIPKEIYANKAKLEAWSKDPRAAGFGIAENQIGQAQAQAVRASQQGAGSSADALSQVGNIQKNTINQYGQLAAMGAQQQRGYRTELLGANSDLAGYKDMKFDVNKMQPYRQNVERSDKLIDENRMDNQNIVNDAQAIGALGANAFSKKKAPNSNKRSVRPSAAMSPQAQPYGTPGSQASQYSN